MEASSENPLSWRPGSNLSELHDRRTSKYEPCGQDDAMEEIAIMYEDTCVQD